MSHDLSLKETQNEYHGTLKSYLIGFSTSLLLTLLSFTLVVSKLLSGNILIYTLSGLALVQAILQLLLFLHLGKEAKPRWESLIFGFMVLILLIIVIGSLWIMSDLNERMMMNMPGMISHD